MEPSVCAGNATGKKRRHRESITDMRDGLDRQGARRVAVLSEVVGTGSLAGEGHTDKKDETRTNSTRTDHERQGRRGL